jgi:hypothetical protein
MKVVEGLSKAYSQTRIFDKVSLPGAILSGRSQHLIQKKKNKQLAQFMCN